MAKGYLSKSQAIRYLKELAGKTNRDFQRGCYELLKEVWPEMRYAKDLREFDRAGIDLYLANPKNSQFSLVMQCKGFEALNFSEKQFGQCVESIGKYVKSKYSCDEYILVVNQPYFKDTLVRRKLEKELKTIEEAGKSKKTALFDLRQFLNFLFDNLVDLLLKRFEIQNSEYLNQYETVMGSGVYVSEVPFKRLAPIAYGKNTGLRSNPLQFICRDIEAKLGPTRKEPGRQVQKFWTIVVSEFGFGKTSLLLRIAGELNRLGFGALYVPIALIPPNGFDAETNFIRCLWQIIFEPSAELDLNRPSVWDVPLRDILQSRQDFVILLDGLDEHRYAYTHEGIRQIMNGLRHLTRHVVLSVRREFWDERSGSIEMAIGRADRNSQVVVLDEWSEEAIILFLNEKRRVTGSTSLNNLVSLVKAGQYQEFYGDIPKRPLFLEMLAQDVIDGQLKKRTVAQLYEKYLVQKMERDVTSPYSSNKYTGRPLASHHLDLFDLQGRLLGMLEEVAAKTAVSSAQTGSQLLEKFPEEWVKAAAKSVDLPADSVLPYMIGTVLVPVGKRTRQPPFLEVRFAHRSYQEYFIARKLSKGIGRAKDPVESLITLRSQYSKGVISFLESILSSPLVHQP